MSTRSRLVRAPRTRSATSTSLMIRLASVAPRLRASERTRISRTGVEWRIAEAMRIPQQRFHPEHILPARGLRHAGRDPSERVANVLNGGSAEPSGGELGEEAARRHLEVAATMGRHQVGKSAVEQLLVRSRRALPCRAP
jgi:hypothetical protein